MLLVEQFVFQQTEKREVAQLDRVASAIRSRSDKIVAQAQADQTDQTSWCNNQEVLQVLLVELPECRRYLINNKNGKQKLIPKPLFLKQFNQSDSIAYNQDFISNTSDYNFQLLDNAYRNAGRIYAKLKIAIET